MSTYKSAYYIVRTGTGYFGKGWSIKEAAKAAQCLNPKGNIRRNVGQTLVSKITGDIEHTLTENDLNPMHNGGLSYQGFKPGDKHLPWVTQYGSLVYWGALENLGTLTAEML